jgi:uncharacterized membrane protein
MTHLQPDLDAHPQPRPVKTSSLRRAIWRGSSIIAPPLVTLLLLIWIARAVEDYVLLPLEGAGRSVLVWFSEDILEAPPENAELNDTTNPAAGFIHQGKIYVPPPSGRKFIPEHVLLYVDANIDALPREMQDPKTANAYYHAYVKMQYMPRWFTIPLLLLVLFSVLFFVGRFLAAGMGRIFVNGFERAINSLPVVRNLYSSVKQVTDFVLSEREIEFTRVVAIEHPRVGIWALGFVTSDGIPQLAASVGEEVVAVFVPTSPMPMTGFTVNTRKRDLIDLDLTIDQAIQFIVSCGVVCPTMVNLPVRSATPVRIDPPDAP